jgi:hypothetical protein
MGRRNHLLVALIFGLCTLLPTATAQAQIIEAPQLLCVKGDTLNWSLPNVNCGPFLGYEIYASSQAEGPFSLLALITDPSSTQFVHTNSPGLWFYYMRSDYDCPGWTSASSDTLNNLPPLAPVVRRTSVENNAVFLEWIPSPSKQVYAHIIYRATAQGTIPIDTVFLPQTTYIDAQAAVNDKEEYYYVLALDPCGNTSGFVQLQKTIFLSGDQDACLRTLTLDWSEYIGFSKPIEKYEMAVWENGIQTLVLDITEDLGLGSTLSEIEQGIVYCLRVVATEEESGERSQSNEICLVGEAKVPLTHFNYRDFSIAPDNSSLLVSWRFNEDFEYQDFYANLGYTLPLTPASQIALLNPLDNPGQASATLPIVSGENRPLHGYIASLDVCDRFWVQDTLTSLYLEVKEGENGNNLLQWNTPIWPQAQLIQYDVFFENENSIVRTVPQDQNNFLHSVEEITGSEEGFCYKIIAHWEIPEDNQTKKYSWTSNRVCLKRESLIFMANAIRPGGNNASIRPLIKFNESVETYQFTVFDRQGSILFSSLDMNQSWSGTNGQGKPLSPGVYAYSVQVKLQDGRKLSKKGTIALIR